MDMKDASADDHSCSAFESRVDQLVRESRGLLSILKSAKGLEPNGKESQIYRLTLKRFREHCLRLAEAAEACALLRSPEERDRMLGKSGCSWDDAKKRVLLG